MTNIVYSETFLFMRIFLIVLIFIFNIQSLTKADDIRDFEIEGMSIGDSALNFFSKKDLITNQQLQWYDTEVFTPIAELKLENSKTYQSFQIAVKTNDQKYKIESLAGFVFYKNNINECYNEIDNISESIKNLFEEISDSGIQTVIHGYDKSGESTVTGKTLTDKAGNVVVIDCYDWSDKFEWWDQLRITIATKYYANYKKKFLN